ncbi:MAG: cell wall-active antibiotics response protein [Bacteroidetes bacterium]|nr:cell wall-active antibiotics response protein [Bacteroidota bacterium]MBU1678308.1 cell wall-active antibiotics response protein [Bacteroidota bacterium]
MSNSNHTNIRAWFGVIVTLLGVLFLLKNFDILDFEFPFQIFSFWSILIIIGFILIFSSHNKSTGIILVVIGAIGHLPEMWPLVLIGLGIYIILKKSGAGLASGKFEKSFSGSDSNDLINDTAIFGGGNKYFQSDNFMGGSITAIFGGSEVDFIDCKLAEGNHVIDVFFMFGGATLIMPSDWRVEIDLVPIFGGFSDRRRKDPNMVPQTDRKVVLKGLVLFGGGEIKN